MRGALVSAALLALAACDGPLGSEVAAGGDEVAPTGQSTEIDSDGGRAFADRETFQRYCPVRSAILSQQLGDAFEPVHVYLAPAEPDGASPEEGVQDLAICHYRSTREQWLFTATYIREAPAGRAQRVFENDGEMWSAFLVPPANGASSDDAFVMYQDFPDGGYLTVRFVQGDVTVEYLMFGATPDERAEAMRSLPRPDAPSL